MTKEIFNASYIRKCTRNAMTTPGPTRDLLCGNSLGFTLIELIVIMLILGVLALLSVPGFSFFTNKAKSTACMSDLRTLEKDIIAYMIDKGVPPDSLNTIGRGNLRDPWGNPFQYYKVPKYTGYGPENLNLDFDLFSMGKDGASNEALSLGSNTDDDIIRAAEGGFVGLGIQY